MTKLNRTQSIRTAASRRRFLQASLGTSLVLGVDAIAPQWFAQAATESADSEDHVLVVIQLSGGNDGLNTVIPYADEEYSKRRPKLGISAQDVLQVNDTLGLHPAMKSVAGLVEDGLFSIVQGVGYANPNRSHFESMDIWHSCGRDKAIRRDGWLGRMFDGLDPSSLPDVPAIHLGASQQPLALRAERTRVPSIRTLDEFRLTGKRGAELQQLVAEAANAGGTSTTNDLLGFVQSSTASAMMASERVGKAAGGSPSGDGYPDSELGRQLSVVARLVAAELPTKVYYLELDGFDTHARQAESHASLLGEWSDAVTAFVRETRESGNGERVSVLTFSEFGRRVQENASEGTDHGAAAPLFLAGAGIQKTIVGEQPSLTDLEDGDLKFSIDFRQVYASILQDWLKVDPAEVLQPVDSKSIFEPLPLYKS
ncbi:MAG: DUF1501 domain-containing protein [Pirellulaceae bacterium]